MMGVFNMGGHLINVPLCDVRKMSNNQRQEWAHKNIPDDAARNYAHRPCNLDGCYTEEDR
jgi:hypothetical protein